ncbi:MAG: PIN domain-containing protein [Coriobacteriia bacterium]
MEAIRRVGGERVVLDSWAIDAMMLEEPSAQVVDDIVSAARDAHVLLPMCSVNWCEVLYGVPRKVRGVAPEDVVVLLRALPIAVVDATQELSARAALLKFEHSISLGDAYAAALAMSLDAPLLTGDTEFAALEPGLKVRWLPR